MSDLARAKRWAETRYSLDDPGAVYIDFPTTTKGVFWQVDSNLTASIYIEGRCNASFGGAIRGRFVPSKVGGTPSPWTSFATAAAGVFSGNLPVTVAQGYGQGALEVHAAGSRLVTTVSYIGLGTLVVMAGASIIDGTLDDEQDFSPGGTYTDVTWGLLKGVTAGPTWSWQRPGADPAGTGSHGTWAPLVASKIVQDTGLPVGIVMLTKPGSGIAFTGTNGHDWKVGGEMYERGLDIFQQHHITRAIWMHDQHLNEAVNIATYEGAVVHEQNIQDMYDGFAAQIPGLRFGYGIGPHLDVIAGVDPDDADIMNDVWQSVGVSDPTKFYPLPMLADMVVDGSSDGIHPATTAGGIERARRYTLGLYAANSDIYDQLVTTDARRGPRFVSATKTATSVTARFLVENPGGITLGARPEVGVRVVDDSGTLTVSNSASTSGSGTDRYITWNVNRTLAGTVRVSWLKGFDGVRNDVDSGTIVDSLGLPPERFVDQVAS